jgi:hypothetical protein
LTAQGEQLRRRSQRQRREQEEASEERDNRFNKNVIRQRNIRERESDRQREIRLRENSDRQNITRLNETQDEREERLEELLARYHTNRARQIGQRNKIAFIEDHRMCLNVEEYLIGLFDKICNICGALHFEKELNTPNEHGVCYSSCCSYGKLIIHLYNIM